ncbi:MAG: response regulator, partial [Chloroflexaceae bacterium]
VPIIVVTASGKEADATRSARVGADLFLTKPVESSDLVQAVAQVLARERSQDGPLQRWRRSRVA